MVLASLPQAEGTYLYTPPAHPYLVPSSVSQGWNVESAVSQLFWGRLEMQSVSFLCGTEWNSGCIVADGYFP